MTPLKILAFVVIASIGRGSCERVFVFQGDNQLSNESRAVIYLEPPSPRGPKNSLLTEVGTDNADEGNDATAAGDAVILSDLSVCLWFKVNYFRKTSGYVFSYATSDVDSNELNLGIAYRRILIAVGGRYVYGKKDVFYFPDKWYHMCFVADSKNRTGTFYINGKIQSATDLSPRRIVLNGSLVLGQETDLVDGGYQSLQSFSGSITGFNLYSRTLTSSEILQLSGCSPLMEGGDVVDWNKAVWEVSGPVTIEDIEEEEYCVPDTFNFIVVSKKTTHERAKQFCKSIKSTLALPRSPEENAILYEATEVFADVCQPHNHATGFLWLGANRDSGTWVDENGIPLIYNNFPKKQTRGCVAFKIPPDREEWHSVSCTSTYEFCSACQEEKEKSVTLKMRGLCEADEHDYYFRMVHQHEEMPYFKGYTKYNLIFNNGTWELHNVWSNKVLAKFFNYAEDLPFGRRQWWTTTNFDVCKKRTNTSLELSLSACYDWEYSCSDGSCVNLTQRCDLRVDCPDMSDEINCEKLIKPTDYLGALPPPGLQPGNPLHVNISVNLQGFSEIDIRDMKLVVEFTLIMTWSDSRLRYKNLSPMPDLNYVETKRVWIPKVDLTNADFPKTYTTDAVLHILRRSEPEKDDLSRISRDEVYEGATNSLRLTQKFNAPFSCVMDMKNFPFDRQRCQLHIRFSSAKEEFMEWDHLSAKYLGERLLAEYLVENISIEKGTTEDYSEAIVNITFSRRYSYYVTSAYLPTVMLMIISYASLFCKKENSDLRVMMALTALLVLYALYQQISNDLPRTSYTKAIDIWCFFSLTFIFSQVILHVIVDIKFTNPFLARCCCQLSRANENQTKDYPAKVSPTKVIQRSQEEHNNEVEHALTPEMVLAYAQNGRRRKEEAPKVYHNSYHLLPFAQIFYVVFFITFCVIYWSVVLTSE